MANKLGWKILLILFVFWVPKQAFSQYWNKNSWEGIYGIGATNLMTDIGGPSALTAGVIKENFWLTPQSFRPVFYVGVRFLQNNRLGYKVNIATGSFSSADIYNDYWMRNLISNTFFFEFSGQFEYFVIKETGKRNVYRSRTYKWYKNLNVPTYFFIGGGGNLFFTKTQRNNKYLYEPFATSTFTQLDSSKHFTAVIPFGIGIKYRLNKEIRFGVEAGYRFAFSDYLDNYSPVSSNWPDSYQFLLFTLNYKLKTGRSGLPRLRFR